MAAISGAYGFTGLEAGSYEVVEIAPAGWNQTTMGPAVILLTSGQEYMAVPGQVALEPDQVEVVQGDLAIGNFRLGSIHGIKFEDHDQEGDRDAEDQGLADWTIELYKGGALFATDLTDAATKVCAQVA